MDIETETPSVETESTETTVDSTPAIETAPVDQVVAPVVEEFTPNYKYKAYGKEFEIDEWARPLLNKDTQPHLVKLFEKAGGFEPLKERYESTTQELGTYKTAYTELDGVRNAILENVNKGDLGNVFKIMGVKDEQVMDYVRSRLEYQNMPPEQRRQIDERNQLTQRESLYQQQLQEQQQYTQNLIMEKHELELQTNFSSPKYAPLISSYNQRAGNENAFRAAVEKVGAYELHVNNKNISVAEAIEGAIQMLGLQHDAGQAPVQIPQDQAPQVANGNNRPAPKPIVVANGSSSTPVKKRPMSINDLKKEYSQLNDQN